MLAVIILSLTLHGIHSQSECYNAYSCASANISSTESIHCWGYHSCYQASLQTSSIINCNGAYSCLNANMAYSNTFVFCYGLGSCARIDLLGDIAEPIQCYSELSCYQSNIFAYYVYCRGERSCADTTVHLSSTFYAYAYASAQNCTFYSIGLHTHYFFYGSYSGDNATIICGNGHRCFVYCQNTGCNNLNMLCNGTCTFGVFCNNDAFKSDICSNGKIINQEKLKLLSFDDIYENRVSSPCDTSITNAIHCDDYQECYDSASLDENAPICCTSSFGCYHVNNITSMFLSNSSVINGIAIRCDGYWSCGHSNHIQARNGGDIHISGLYAGHSVGIIETTLNYDIFCTSYSGCSGATLKNANNTYCTAYTSCQYTFIVNVSNVWMYGHYAGYNSRITGLKNELHCAGDYSCKSTNISGAMQVIARGFQAVKSASVTAVDRVCF